MAKTSPSPRRSKFSFVIALALSLVGLSAQAAVVSCVNCAQEITTQTSLTKIAVAITTGVQQIVGAIQGAATAQSTASTEAGRIGAETNARTAAEMAKRDAAAKFEPVDPCSVTAVAKGGYEVQGTRPRGGGRGGGGGPVAKAGASRDMQEALDINVGNKPAPAPEVAAALAAKGACSTFAKGGVREQGCADAGFSPSLSSGYPNADVKAETLFDGPQSQADMDKGLVRKLTIAPGDSKEKMAIAAFIRNLETPVDLRTLSKAEINSEAGRNYMAFRDGYDAAMSMATKPLRDQESLITANKATLPVLKQLMKGEDSRFIGNYLNRVYPNWQRDGISYAELLQLEASRRYLNEDWHTRMAAADDRQLLAELVQLQAVNNWVATQGLEKSQQIAILVGTMAGAGIRSEKMPQLLLTHKAARK